MPTYKIYDERSYETLYRKIKEYFYRKSELYSKTQIDSMLSSALKFTIVQSLPEVGENGTIYLVPKDVPSQDDVYDEYIWTSTQGQIQQHYEHIGSTQIDLSNYYTKSEVDSLLNGKQGSITITTNANTPTDNDTIVMQDNGNTGTISFLRRKLSTLWDYIKGKADEVYVPFPFVVDNVNMNGYPTEKRLYNVLYDDVLYAADERFSVTRTIYNSNNEVVTTLPAANLFKTAQARYATHPAEGEREVILIQPASQQLSDYMFTYGYGYFILDFDYNQLPDNVKIRFRKRNNDWTQYYDMPRYSGTMYRYSNNYTASTATYLNAIEIVIYGKNTGNNTTSAVSLYFVSMRPGYNRSGISKHNTEKDIYGNIIAPKFIKRNGTNSQVLLANGDVMSLPVPVNKGGTGATTAIGAEYNILNQVADSTAQLTDLNDNRKIALCNLTKSSTNGVFRWMTLGLLWNYIKNKISSVLGIDENSLNSKVNLLADFTINSIDYSSSNVGKYQKLIRFPKGSTIIINVIRNHTMYGRTDSHTNMLIIDGYSGGSNYVTTLIQSELRVINEGNYSFVICPCASYYGSPTFTYKLQILFSNVSIDNIEAVESSVIISASPRDNFVIYNKPVTLGSYTFNMSGSSTSLYLVQGEDHFYSFIGNVTGTISENYSIYLRDVEIGQVYQFVFTEDIPAGLRFVDDDNYYDACTIPTTIGAGDTLTLTAASATQDGWLYSIQKFEIESPDESIDVKYHNGITQLEVSKRFVKNNAEYYYENDEHIAIGSYAQTLKLTGDNNARFAYTKTFNLQSFKVDGGSEEFYHVVSQGTTYTISVGSYSTQFTAIRSGCVVLVSSLNNELFNYDVGFYTSDGYYNEFYTNDIQAFRSYSICLLDATSSEVFALLDSATIVKVWVKTYISSICTALGDSSEATGIYASAFGYYARALNEHSIAIGYASLVLGASSIAMGGSAKALKNYSVAIGVNSKVFGSSVGMGYNARCTDNGVSIGANSSSENNGVAVGNYASSSGNEAVAIGNSSNASNVRAIAIGYANASGSGAVAIGYNAKGLGYSSIAILGSAGGTDCIAIGFLSNVANNKNYSVAIGYQAKCSDDDSVALGSNTESVGRNSVSIGHSTKCNTNYAIAIGNDCNSVGTDCIAIGDNVKSGNVSDDSNRQYLTMIKMNCVPYVCDSQTIYNKRSDVDLYVTIDNHQYTLTPPSTNRQLVIVNNSNAQYLKYGSANGYEFVLVDGLWRSENYVSGTLSGCVTHLHDDYYAVWLYCTDASYYQATESFVFYPLMSTTTSPQQSCCVGGDIISYHRNSHAIGYKCVTSADNQFVIGNYNTLNDNARFIIGGGNSMSRKNILEIDNNDRLKINASLIGGTQTINMNQQTGMLSNITKSIYKIKWNGTGSVRLTLGTGGCVEGQRVSIAAVTNDVVIGTSILIPAGTFGDFLFLDGEWMPSSGVWHV